MNFQESVIGIASRFEQQRDLLRTEEATKNAVVMPMIAALGYNVFDPSEVIPEFTADVGTKKGEKVDYAIVIDGEPMVLVETKTVGTNLSLNCASQLYRYFGVTEARFAVLTNGQYWWFYSDLEQPNRMDERTFFEFDLLDYDAASLLELSKFAKNSFDLDAILSNASELKYAKRIKKHLSDEMENPSDDFVKLFAGRVYSGRLTVNVQEQFRQLVSNACTEFIRDKVNARLKSALNHGGSLAPPIVDENPDAEDEKLKKEGVDTTAEEIEAFHVARAILARDINPCRIIMRDTKSYCGVLLDDNNRKPICRLHFNTSQRYVGLFDAEKNETRHPITSPHELYQFADQLLEAAKRYDGVADRKIEPAQP